MPHKAASKPADGKQKTVPSALPPWAIPTLIALLALVATFVLVPPSAEPSKPAEPAAEAVAAVDSIGGHEAALRSMATLSAAFLIVTKNGENELPYTIKNIEAAASQFKDYVVIVYENDSRDQTVEVLRDWKESSNGKVVVMTETGVKVPGSWLNAVARARNKCMQELEKDRYASFEHVIIVDTDMCRQWAGSQLFSQLFMPPVSDTKWSMISANGIGAISSTNPKNAWVYMDRFAYRDNFTVCWDPEDGPIIQHPQVIAIAV